MKEKSIKSLINIIYNLKDNCTYIRRIEDEKEFPNYSEYYKMIALLNQNVCQYLTYDKDQQVIQDVTNWIIKEEKIIQSLMLESTNTKIYRSLNQVFLILLNIENYLE